MFFKLFLILSITIYSNAIDFSALHRLFYKYVNEPDEDSSHIEPNYDILSLVDEKSENIPTEKLTNIKRPCDENKLLLRLANLQITSPEKIMLTITMDNLNELCRTLNTNINEVEHEFENCFPPLDKDNLYRLIYQGMKVLNRKLCAEHTVLFKKVTIHHSCLKDLRQEYVDCEGPADWFERSNATLLCPIFEDIINCSFVKTAELCGLEAAHVIRCLSTNVFNGSITTNCKAGDPPRVQNPMPLSSSSVQQLKCFQFVLLSILWAVIRYIL